MPPRTPEQFSEIRQEKCQIIMDTALELFSLKGYHTTSISAIAKHAGISKGLIYNYFDSKLDLLKAIINQISDEVMDMLNPNHDDEITTEEFNDFFDLLFASLKEKKEYWKLYFQLTIQPGVFDSLYSNNFSEDNLKNQQLIYKHFAERYENPDEMMIIVTSIIKGFSLQYVFVPELFNDDLIDRLKFRLKELFIKPQKYNYDSKKVSSGFGSGFSFL